MWGPRRRRREAELAELDRWRAARKLAAEDVTVLGEQVADLHVDTLVDDLAPEAVDHYRRALVGYDQAKHLLAASETAEDVLAVEQVVADARYHRAAVLAIRDGEPLPARRGPCFFNPQHGPSVQGAVDAGAQLGRASSHGVHGQQNLAQAYLNQATGGIDGSRGAGFGLGPDCRTRL